MADETPAPNGRDWRDREEPNESWAARYGGDFARAMAFLQDSADHNEAVREREEDRRKREEEAKVKEENRKREKERDARERAEEKARTAETALAMPTWILSPAGRSSATKQLAVITQLLLAQLKADV